MHKSKLYYCNINGFTSKSTSLNMIIKDLQPTIIALCETKVAKNKNFTLPGYEVIKRNSTKGKGGLMMAVKSNIFSSALETTVTDNSNIMSSQLTYKDRNYRVIVVYGLQENDSCEEKNEFFDDLDIEIENGLLNGGIPIVVGDFNAKITDNGEEITAQSGNGKMLKQLMEKHTFKALNFHQNATGQYTRIKSKNGAVEKSTIDYVLCGEQMYELAEDVLIDEDKVVTPFRVLQQKGKEMKMVHTDHTAIVVTFNLLHTILESVEEDVGWIITQEGLEKFKELTKSHFYTVQRNKDVNSNYNAWQNRLLSTVDKCFKKNKRSAKKNPVCQSIMPVYKELRAMKKLGKRQRVIATEYIQVIVKQQANIVAEKNANRIKKVTATLTAEEKLSPNGFWKLAKAVNKKLDNKSSVIHNGTEIFGTEFIKGAYKSEFQFRLREREITPGLKVFEKMTEELVTNYVKYAQEIKNEEPFSMDEIKGIIDTLANKKAPGADGIRAEFLKAGGEDMRQSLLDLYNYMKEYSCLPHQWEKVLIRTIYKNKGSKKELVNYRGIFLTALLSKIFEKLIKKRINIILKRVNNFQAGGRAGKGTVDNLFILRGVIDHYKYINVPLFITVYDYKQAFDSLWLDDCILSMWNVGLRNEMLTLIYKLNMKAEVVVKTPYGPTESFKINKLVKQGTVLGTDLCGTPTGEYCDMNDGVPIGNVTLGPLAFVDDLLQMNISAYEARLSHARAVAFSKLKRLEFNVDKCYGIIINGGKLDEYPEQKIGDCLIQEKESVTYLGDVMDNKGSNTSLINDRVKKASGKLVGAFSLVDEVTFGVHRLSTQILVYHSIFLPTMLYNCQSWSNITPTEMNKLAVMQLKYLKRVLKVPTSTSNAFVYLELGILPIEYEIHRRKLAYLWKILNKTDDEPVLQLYLMQKSLPAQKNWANNMTALRSKYSISENDDSIKNMKYSKYKQETEKKLSDHAFQSLKEKVKETKKTKDLMYQDLQQQQYLTTIKPELMQIIIRIRCRMLDIATHRPYLFTDGKKSLCRHCQLAEESLHHIVNCYLVSPCRERINENIYGDLCDEMEVTKIAKYVKKYLEMEELA